MTRLPADILRDPALIAVLDAIEAGGHRALLVGGAVRNALLACPVEDIDIATDARPDDVMRLVRAAGLKAVPTGIDHGTITVVSDTRGFEVTTFRHDLETDGRHAVVAFSDDLAEDARRRDFTINALYAGRDGKVVDPVGGLPDLAARRLRFVGQAQARIREDYLRILRFFRIHAAYGAGEPDREGYRACIKGRDGLATLSAERMRMEMLKLAAAGGALAAIVAMEDAGLLLAVIGGVAYRGPLEAMIAIGTPGGGGE